MEAHAIIERNADGQVVFGGTEVPVATFLEQLVHSGFSEMFASQNPSVTAEHAQGLIVAAVHALAKNALGDPRL